MHARTRASVRTRTHAHPYAYKCAQNTQSTQELRRKAEASTVRTQPCTQAHTRPHWARSRRWLGAVMGVCCGWRRRGCGVAPAILANSLVLPAWANSVVSGIVIWHSPVIRRLSVGLAPLARPMSRLTPIPGLPSVARAGRIPAATHRQRTHRCARARWCHPALWLLLLLHVIAATAAAAIVVVVVVVVVVVLMSCR